MFPWLGTHAPWKSQVRPVAVCCFQHCCWLAFLEAGCLVVEDCAAAFEGVARAVAVGPGLKVVAAALLAACAGTT